MKKFLFTLLVSTLLFSCKRNHNLGLIITSSDIFLSFGISARNATELSVENFNQHSNKNKIIIQQTDDQKNHENAIDFIKHSDQNNKLFGIIGPLSSSVAKGSLDTINYYKIPTIAPLTNIEFLKNKDDYLFTMNTKITTTALETANLIIKENKQNDNFIIIYNDSNSHYFKEFLDIIYKSLTTNYYNNVFTITVQNNPDNNYTEIIKKAMSLNPSAALIIDDDLNSAIIAQTLKLQNKQIKLYGTEFAITSRIIANGGSAVDNMKFVTSISYDPSLKEVSEFIYAYNRKYNYMPDATAYLTFISTNALLTAFSNANFDKSKLKKELLLLKKENKLLFNEYGDSEKKPIKLVISKGKFITINE
ncbi:MAG TPA: hypothetical protein DDY71_12925 [Spirochaetia bacterium]|nr:MAG: hypothetical protein A2Y30_14000 [Spirochaetes bacterium GWE1_32_154]OHD50069.1 MAG: hypothetical protein A2Y29_12045 [Spirochaetes bacterium GWE2_31_10]HBD96026.1 hypothetical protein [Spirochaetia bacterium]HBI38538.1 hypothetical protein [Spirochaetia bacterium]